MKPASNKQEMHKVELLIGQILRVGVIVSAIVIAIGLVLLVVTQDSGYAGTQFPTSFQAIFAGLMTFKPYAIIMLGVFLLILTPVLRVVVSIYAFFKEGDHLYVGITVLVLLILVVSMVIGYFGK